VIVFAVGKVAFFNSKDDRFVEPNPQSDENFQPSHAAIWL
jgi:hypothetical protein